MAVLILGPTGKHPDGKLKDDDDGELMIAIGTNSGNVEIQFGTYINWLAMDPKRARQFAAAIIAHANDIQPEEL